MLLQKSFNEFWSSIRFLAVVTIIAVLPRWVFKGMSTMLPVRTEQVNGFTRTMVDFSHVSPMLLAVTAVLGIVVTIVALLLHTAYWIVAVDGTKDLKKLWQAVCKNFFPIIGIIFWIVVRTYVWVAFAAIVFAILGFALPTLGGIFPFLFVLSIVIAVVLFFIRGPRYVAAQYLYLRDHKDVRAAIDASYVLTDGYWGKIVGNLLLFSLVLTAFGFIVGILLGIVFGISNLLLPGILAFILALVPLFIATLQQAFLIFFMKDLAETIEAHALAKAKRK